MRPISQLRLVALSGLIYSLTVAAQTVPSSGPPNVDVQSLMQAADAAREVGDADEAIRDYKRAVTIRPDFVEGWWDLGTEQYDANLYGDAIVSIKKLTVLVPSSAPSWSMLGLAEFETKDYSSALTSLEKAQKLGGVTDPDIARVSAYHLALLLIRNSKFERASALVHSTFGAGVPTQAKFALGLTLLHVPLLPTEVDPSHEALIQAAGQAAATPDGSLAMAALIHQYPSVPWLHYDYGLVLEDSGHLHDALEQEKLETTISPTSELPWIEISRIALRLKETHLAVDAANRAVKLSAGSPAAHDSLSKALVANGRTQQAALESRIAARLPQAAPRPDSRMISLYGTHSGSGPGSEDSATWQVAMHAYSSAKYPEAVNALKRWIQQNPSDGTAWAVMGLSEFALKDYDNARIHLQRGINLGLKGSDQSLQFASEQLAFLLVRNHEFDTATALLTPLANHPPLSSNAQLALGLAMLHVPILPGDLDPSQRNLALFAGSIVESLLTSHYADAFPAFQKLIAAHPATPWLHYAYGDALDSVSQYVEAKTQFEAELRVAPHNALPWTQIASIDLQMHIPSDALQAAQAAASIAPDSAEAHYELGRAWLENGDSQKAINELQKANFLKPNNPEIHFILARAYTKADLPEKAAAERATFLQLKEMASRESGSVTAGGSILQPNVQ